MKIIVAASRLSENMWNEYQQCRNPTKTRKVTAIALIVSFLLSTAIHILAHFSILGYGYDLAEMVRGTFSPPPTAYHYRFRFQISATRTSRTRRQ
jgi:hypothetical protein